MVSGSQGGTDASFEGSHSRRLVFAYKAGSLVAIAMGLGWGVAFLSMQWWLLAGAEVLLVLVGAVSWLLIHRGYLSVALIISELAFLAFTVFFCLVYDVPSDAVPRVSHLYLLVLAMLGYINYLRTRSKLQLCIIAMCLVAFVSYASFELSFPFAQPIPDAFRAGSAWINVLLSTAMLCGCTYAMQLEFARTSSMARELQAALWNRELSLHYQPLVNRDGQTLGAEALMRWQSPRRGAVSPADFIPHAEQAGLMPEIGAWVLGEACRTLALWAQSPATRHLTLAVNVSASQFLDNGFEDAVLKVIAAHDIDPHKLTLELTESVMVVDMDVVVAKMHVLRAVGVGIALDDFGTGYSALGYLRQLPLNQLKMDRSFVQDMLENERSASLARSILRLGKDMGIIVLAEGVETQEQFSFLLDNGCAEFQGYLFGRPVPREQFDQRMIDLAA